MSAVQRDRTTMACRGCGSTDLDSILSLGELPLANALCDTAEGARMAPRFRTHLLFCHACALVQLERVVRQEDLFQAYPYYSSQSATMLQHASDLVSRLVRERGENPRYVVEVGGNDGYLLQYYRARGIDCLNVEPSEGPARAAEDKGIPTVSAFFGKGFVSRPDVPGRKADIIHVHNVLAHVEDLADFSAGLAELLAEDGTLVVEVPYVRKMVEGCEFDQIYHEHGCYFSLTSLRRIFEGDGKGNEKLRLWGAAQTPMHGGSLLCFLGKAGGGASWRSEAWSANQLRIFGQEAGDGIDAIGFYRPLQKRIDNQCTTLSLRLRRLKAEGRRIVGYGAPAKATVLLNYGALDGYLEALQDSTPAKQGRFQPGTGLPIVAPGTAHADVYLLLAWNFAEEILHKEDRWRREGGRFLLPFPEVKEL